MTQEQSSALAELLSRALAAARKLETMYMRRECAPRSEVDRLIEIIPQLSAAIEKLATPNKSDG